MGLFCGRRSLARGMDKDRLTEGCPGQHVVPGSGKLDVRRDDGSTQQVGDRRRPALIALSGL